MQRDHCLPAVNTIPDPDGLGATVTLLMRQCRRMLNVEIRCGTSAAFFLTGIEEGNSYHESKSGAGRRPPARCTQTAAISFAATYEQEGCWHEIKMGSGAAGVNHAAYAMTCSIRNTSVCATPLPFRHHPFDRRQAFARPDEPPAIAGIKYSRAHPVNSAYCDIWQVKGFIDRQPNR